MKNYIHLIMALVAGLLSVPAMAASSSCYQPAQMEAEQLLRLHSELMVITVTCREGSGGQDLPAAYGQFTKRNIGALHKAEQVMQDYYRSQGQRNTLDKLDHLRTLLGNEYGQKAADMSAPAFCAAYRDRVVQYQTAPITDIQNEVQRMEVAEKSYAKPCNSRGNQVAKRN